MDELALDEVVQPARRGDEDVGPVGAARLFLDVRPSVDGLHVQPLGLRDVLEVVAHLHGQFARRHEDDRLRVPIGPGVELVDDRDREAERLARPSLRLRQRVASRSRVLDHHHLDRERNDDPAGDEGLDDRLRHAEVAERKDFRRHL